MTAIVFTLLAILPPDEQTIVNRVASRYRLSEEQTALLCAIRKAENGAPHLAFGVNDMRARIKDGRSFERQCEWAAGTIRKRYNGDVTAFARRYSPARWRTWLKNVRFFINRQKGGD